MKYLIFDTGSLINFTTNGILHLLEKLKENFDVEFLITNSVKYEAIDHPLNVKRFEWGALRINDLLKRGIIKIAEDKIVKSKILKPEMKRILELSNNTFIARGQPVHIIDDGEAETLALSKILTSQGKENLIVIDERTARMLVEKPNNIKKLLGKKLHTHISAKQENFKEFKEFRIIRSTELAYIAYKKGYTKLKDPRTLDAILYGLKFGGTSINDQEIKQIKKLAKK